MLNVQPGLRATQTLIARTGQEPTPEELEKETGVPRDKLEAPTMLGGPTVPFLASNVNAARALAEIGTDLATAGGSLTTAVDPDKLEFVDGILPLREVAKITPAFVPGSAVLSRSSRLDRIAMTPTSCRRCGAIDKVRTSWLARTRGGAPPRGKLAEIFGGQTRAPTSWWSRTTRIAATGGSSEATD